MKKVLFSLLTLILVGCATSKLPPTGPTKKMIKGADTIILRVNESQKQSYKHLYHFLSDKGFGFRNTDKTLMLLRTDYQTFRFSKTNSIDLAINASVRKDSTIVFNGRANIGIGKGYKIYNKKGLDFSDIRHAWKQLNKIVSSYPHSQLLFKRTGAK